jgi:hypothetical protein
MCCSKGEARKKRYPLAFCGAFLLLTTSSLMKGHYAFRQPLAIKGCLFFRLV